MAISNYSELLTAVGTWINRSDLTARIPEFIALAEARFNRTIWAPQSENVLTANSNVIALPADYRALRNLYIESNPRVQLEQLSPAALRLAYNSQTTGKPQAFAIIDEAIVFGPALDTTYSCVLDYYQNIPALNGTTQTTNWLLSAHPDIYLYATLLQTQAFLMGDSDQIGEQITIWKGALDEALSELDASSNRRRYGGPIRARALVS